MNLESKMNDLTEKERRELIEDLEIYKKIRKERLQRENPGKKIGDKWGITFVDTTITLNDFPSQ